MLNPRSQHAVLDNLLSYLFGRVTLGSVLKHGYPLLGITPFGADKPDANMETREQFLQLP